MSDRPDSIPDADADEVEAVLVAGGPDRPGLLDEVSRFIFGRGARVGALRICHLRGRTAMLVLAVGPADALDACRRDAATLASATGLFVDWQTADPDAPDAVPLRLNAVGPAGVGLLRRVSNLMRVLNVNLDDVQAGLAPADPDDPAVGVRRTMSLTLTPPPQLSPEKLRELLGQLLEPLGATWDLSAV